MWSNSEYIWRNAQHNWPNARAFTNCVRIWPLLTKCARIWPNVAHLVKCRAFYQFVRCAEHLPKCAVHLAKCADWSNAPYTTTDSDSSHSDCSAYYSFIDPRRMKGWVGLVSWPTSQRTVYPYKWLPINCRVRANCCLILAAFRYLLNFYFVYVATTAAASSPRTVHWRSRIYD